MYGWVGGCIDEGLVGGCMGIGGCMYVWVAVWMGGCMDGWVRG